MTPLLQKAFLEASKLSPREQNRIAAQLLETLTSEQQPPMSDSRHNKSASLSFLKSVVEDNTTPLGKIFDLFIQLLIIASLITFSIETIPDMPASARQALALFETITVIIFTIEYLLRLLVADKKRDFAFSFFGLIDLISILPFYISLGIDLRSLRALRLLRLFRIFKLARYSRAMHKFKLAFDLAREELFLFGAITCLLLFLAATGIYYFEHEAQPETFKSIFTSLWWAVATLTTVGYGDMYPITIGGRIFTFVMLLIGLAVISVPSGLIASALTRVSELEKEEYEQNR